MKLICIVPRGVRSLFVRHTNRERQAAERNASALRANSIWEEKQILLLECLCDYTMTLAKRDFHEPASISPETSSFDDDDVEKGEVSHATTLVSVPSPGIVSNNKIGKRNVSVSCAICLCTYEPDDRITWSSNSSCYHVYHEECIVQWLMSLIQKQRSDLRRRRERARRHQQRQPRQNRNTAIQQAPRTQVLQQEERQETNTTNVSETETPNTVALDVNTNTAAEIATTLITTSGRVVVSRSDLLKNLPKECPCCRQDFISNNVCKPTTPEDAPANVEIDDDAPVRAHIADEATAIVGISVDAVASEVISAHVLATAEIPEDALVRADILEPEIVDVETDEGVLTNAGTVEYTAAVTVEVGDYFRG